MKSFFNIIKYDYLQRTRSYAFLITLCITFAVAFTFVPGLNANYSTIRIANYQGYYNASWIGYVTAIMTSIFVSFVGFYLVNNSIKKDLDTKVGQIIASTKISNFRYLLSKVLSNFFVLLSIVLVVFMMSILLFFWYNTGFNFELISFLKPYVLITIPSIFFVAVFAVIFEVFLGEYSVLQNIGFFMFFAFLIAIPMKNNMNFSFDIIGSRIVTKQMEVDVNKISNSKIKENLSIGYTFNRNQKNKRFTFNGMDFPQAFILSRFIIILLGIVFIGIIAPFFHRFNILTNTKINKKINRLPEHKKTIFKATKNKEIDFLKLPETITNYAIFPLLKTEIILLIRNGKKWLWLLNLVGMLLLGLLPIKITHQFVLPILWFLQIGRLSNLSTKEVENKVHYFAFSSYKPLSRLLFSQLIAGFFMMSFLAIPLLVRIVFHANFSAMISIVLGAIFIVLFAVVLGVISNGKKLFEMLFFLITYAVINGISFFDYFGGLTHHSNYLFKLLGIVLILGVLSFMVRKFKLDKL